MIELLETYAEPLLFVLFIISLAVCISVIKKIGTGVLNVVFISFASGIVLLGESRLFLNLGGWGLYQFTDTTLHIWWHIIFYLSMASFLWGGKRMKTISNSENPVGFNNQDKQVLVLMHGVALSIFFIAPASESWLGPVLENTAINALGVHHFIAMALGLIVAYYMNYIKANWGKVLSVGMTPMIIFLALMGLQHLWELLTESWKVIMISDELIEQVELILLLVGTGFLIGALAGISKVVNNPTVAS